MSFEAELKKFELSSVFTIHFSWLKRYVESDNGMYTPMKNISDDEFREIESSFYALQATWKAWREVKAQAVPEGFVLVPKKPDVDKAWDIALKRIVPPPKTNDAIQQELMCKKYVDDLCSEQDRILLDYEAMIEAQEPTND